MKSGISRRRFLAASAGALAAPFAIARGAQAGGPRRPNILLVFPDQHRADWAAWNPALPVRTPNLARVASEGTRFGLAFCPSPLCAPSRVALALGRRYGNTPVRGNGDNLPDGTQTFYASLRDAGYRVGNFGKLDLRKAAKDWGIDGLHRVDDHAYFREWGFTDGFDSEGKGDSFSGIDNDPQTGKPRGNSPYTHMLMQRGGGALETYIQWRQNRNDSGLDIPEYAYTTPIALPDDAYNDNWVGHNSVELLESFPKDAPWFLQVNFPGPHAPMDITPSMAEWYKDAAFPGPFANDQLPPNTHTAIRRNYSAMVENIDRWLGRFLDTIEARGERGNTLVIYSSDHGEMLGDHNRWAKSLPYQPAANVPLLISGPGIRAAQVHRGPIGTLDLTATILDFAGLPAPGTMDSRSMRPFLEGATETPPRAHAYCALGNWQLVCDGRYKLIRNFDPAAAPKARTTEPKTHPPLLFDLETDPNESKNLATQLPEIIDRLNAMAGLS